MFDERNVVLYTGSTNNKIRRIVKRNITSSSQYIIVSTHAILYDKEIIDNISLVVFDEQHKFGVKQRASFGSGIHMLTMTATPIPRSLALSIYGKTAVSVIDELPAGRKPVHSYIVGTKKRADMLEYIRKHLAAGEQAYFVCQVVYENYSEELSSVEVVYSYLVTLYSDFNVSFIHGRLSDYEKQTLLTDFAEGKIPVLVSSTVIEVGVDVKNATIMCIFNAERFGFTQLHQMRGRVGRGDSDS